MRSTTVKVILFLFLICGAHLGTAEEGAYRIRRYDLVIVPDFKSKVLALRADIDIDNPSHLDSFTFGLNNNYDTVSVRSPESDLRIERASRMITVLLSKPATEFTLSFDLKGNLGRSDDESRDIVADSSLFLLWSDRFYPIDFDHWAAVRMEVVLPSGFQAIAPGRLVSRDTSGSAARYVFEASVPTVKFSLFADCRWIRTERTLDGIPMQTLLYPRSQKFSDQIFTTSSEVLKFFSSIMCAYPFERFSFVTLDSTYARRAFPGFVGYEPRYLEREFTTTGHDAHETSLLWWGYTTHGAGPGSFQWTEGFGDYVEILYDEAYNKPIPKIFERFRSEFLALPADQDVSYTELRGNTPQMIVHGKYPWLMHLIRYRVGDSAFARGIRLLFKRFRFRTFTMDDFISTLEEGCGGSFGWWREEWLERKGVPEIAISSGIERKDSSYVVACTLEQRGNLYHLPLEIGIETARSLRIEKVDLSKRHETFTFESETEPSRIVIDPKGWILMRVLSEDSHK